MEDRGLIDHAADQLPPITTQRVLVLSVLTAGLYIFYWSYYTWKQLQSETREQHYPVWHALTLLVPIYGLFRLHKHFSVINSLATRAGAAGLSPMTGVVLVLLSNVLAYGSLRVTDVATGVVVTVIATALTAAALYLAQDGFNQALARRQTVAATRLGQGISWVEGVLIVLGVFTWIGAFFPTPA